MIQVIKGIDELQRLRSLLSEEQHPPFGIKLIEYEDRELNALSCYSSFLECNIAPIVALNQYSYLEILYSWYYWFTKFLVRYECIYGKYESIRQTQFKIIEAIDYEATAKNGKVDSDLLESIEKELGYCE